MLSTFRLFIFACVFILGSQVQSFAQYELLLQGTAFELAAEEVDGAGISEELADQQIDGRAYALVQFWDIPTSEQRQSYKDYGWAFHEYLPQNAYYVSFSPRVTLPTSLYNRLRAVSAVLPDWKVGESLLNPAPAYAKLKGNLRKVEITYQEGLGETQIANYATQAGMQVLDQNHTYKYLLVAMKDNAILPAASAVWIASMAQPNPPSEPDDQRARGLHRSNHLDQAFSGGRKYDGEGIRVLVRDDGRLEEHIDFAGRLVDLGTNSINGTHGDQVAGVIGGAGNISPTYKGMATGATIYNTNYFSLFTDNNTTRVITEDSVYITNSSYSDGCNAGYTFSSRIVDRQIKDNHSVMHVFSAGNNGLSDCGYGAGGRWGNITGGHKIGKNTITTANLFFNGSIVPSSSRGPTADGRLKPDLAAFGQGQVTSFPVNNYREFGGTSAAAPGIAGVMAQMYHAYRSTHNGAFPYSALIKALMLNTAVDYGNPGPDFIFGWGLVNGRGAVEALEAATYLTDTLDQSDVQEFMLDVPTNTAQARIMLYWHDPEASIGSNLPLINDLDMYVISPQNDTVYPLVLDNTPDVNALNAPAVQGEDHINNTEQVVFNLPASGTYRVVINGTRIPDGPQDYVLTWHWIEDKVEVVFPNGGEKFEVGDPLVVAHWELGSANQSEATIIELSTDGGVFWNRVDELNPLIVNTGVNIPNVATDKALLRVTHDGKSDVSDTTFTISPIPNNLRISSICLDSFTLSWDSLPGVEGFVLYTLGEKFMDSLTVLNSNNVTFAKDDFPTEDSWFAIAMKHTDGWIGQRSNAVQINYSDQLVNCVIRDNLEINIGAPFEELLFTECDLFDAPIQFTVNNTGLEIAHDFNIVYQIDNGVEKSLTILDTIQPGESLLVTSNDNEFLSPFNEHNIVAWVDYNADGFSLDDTTTAVTSYVYFNEYRLINYSESLPTRVDQLPEDWVVINPDDQLTWALTDDIIGYGDTITSVMAINNFNYNNQGAKDYLTIPPLNIPADAPNPKLSFDIAYNYYSNTLADTLLIVASKDCGDTYTDTLYYAFTSELATVTPPTQMSFVPDTATDWNRRYIDLSAYKGDSILIQFVGVCGYGNNIYIDNIGVLRDVIISTNEAFLNENAVQVLPNIGDGQFQVQLQNQQLDELRIYNTQGRLVFSQEIDVNATSIPVDASRVMPQGAYYIQLLRGNELISTKKYIRLP